MSYWRKNMFSVNDIDQLKPHMKDAKGPGFRYKRPNISLQDFWDESDVFWDESDRNKFGSRMVNRIKLRRIVYELYTS